jgi:hypothetical protein
MEFKGWMANGMGDVPDSQKKLKHATERMKRVANID